MKNKKQKIIVYAYLIFLLTSLIPLYSQPPGFVKADPPSDLEVLTFGGKATASEQEVTVFSVLTFGGNSSVVVNQCPFSDNVSPVNGTKTVPIIPHPS